MVAGLIIEIVYTKEYFVIRAFVKGQKVGSVRFEEWGNGTYAVRMIHVHEKHKRKGIGTLLMKTGMNQEKVKRVVLNCEKALLPFYSKLGFVIHKDRGAGCELVWDKQ